MMACVREEQLALYANGDLHAAESDPVREHLAECSLCRQLEAQFQLAAKFVKDSRAEPSEAELRILQARVQERLQPRAAKPAWWLAAAAAVLAILIPLRMRQPAQPEHHKEIAALPLPPRTYLAQATPREIPVKHVRHRTRRQPAAKPGLQQANLTLAPNGKPELKMATADPNVFILYPMDGVPHAD